MLVRRAIKQAVTRSLRTYPQLSFTFSDNKDKKDSGYVKDLKAQLGKSQQNVVFTQTQQQLPEQKPQPQPAKPPQQRHHQDPETGQTTLFGRFKRTLGILQSKFKKTGEEEKGERPVLKRFEKPVVEERRDTRREKSGDTRRDNVRDAARETGREAARDSGMRAERVERAERPATFTKTALKKKEQVKAPVEEKKKKRRSRSQFLGQNLVTTYKYEFREVNLKQQLKSQIKDLQVKSFPYLQPHPQIPQSPRPLDPTYITPSTLQPILTKLFSTLTQSLLNQTPSQQLSQHIEPSFELLLRRYVRLLKSNGYKFNMHHLVGFTPSFKILQVSHIKGLVVIRNHNYTNTEYEVRRGHETMGLVEYWPHKGEADRYPEVTIEILQMAYERINDMVLQVTCQLNIPLDITLTTSKGESKPLPNTHIVQFENQLKHPPLFADMKLPYSEFLTKYRLDNKKWILTNINSSNPNSKFEYSEAERRRLVSRVGLGV